MVSYLAAVPLALFAALLSLGAIAATPTCLGVLVIAEFVAGGVTIRALVRRYRKCEHVGPLLR